MIPKVAIQETSIGTQTTLAELETKIVGTEGSKHDIYPGWMHPDMITLFEMDQEQILDAIVRLDESLFSEAALDIFEDRRLPDDIDRRVAFVSRQLAQLPDYVGNKRYLPEVLDRIAFRFFPIEAINNRLEAALTIRRILQENPSLNSRIFDRLTLMDTAGCTTNPLTDLRENWSRELLANIAYAISDMPLASTDPVGKPSLTDEGFAMLIGRSLAYSRYLLRHLVSIGFVEVVETETGTRFVGLGDPEPINQEALSAELAESGIEVI